MSHARDASDDAATTTATRNPPPVPPRKPAPTSLGTVARRAFGLPAAADVARLTFDDRLAVFYFEIRDRSLAMEDQLRVAENFEVRKMRQVPNFPVRTYLLETVDKTSRIASVLVNVLMFPSGSNKATHATVVRRFHRRSAQKAAPDILDVVDVEVLDLVYGGTYQIFQNGFPQQEATLSVSDDDAVL